MAGLSIQEASAGQQ